MNLVEWFAKFCNYLKSNEFTFNDYVIEYRNDTVDPSHHMLMIKKNGEHAVSMSMMSLAPEVHVFNIRDRRPTGRPGTMWKFPTNEQVPEIGVPLYGSLLDTFGPVGNIIADMIEASLLLLEEKDEA